MLREPAGVNQQMVGDEIHGSKNQMEKVLAKTLHLVKYIEERKVGVARVPRLVIPCHIFQNLLNLLQDIHNNFNWPCVVLPVRCPAECRNVVI